MKAFGFNRHIDNPSAYQDAVQAHIRANARIGRERRWYEADDTRRALIQALGQSRNNFAAKLLEGFSEYGSLTENQERAARNMLERDGVRQQERQEARAREAEISQHVGIEGQRQDFTLTIRVRLEFESQFGTMYIHIMHDASGNVVIYKGSATLGDKGETVTFKATVKRHDVREGVKQTVVARPKFPAPKLPEGVKIVGTAGGSWYAERNGVRLTQPRAWYTSKADAIAHMAMLEQDGDERCPETAGYRNQWE